MTNAITSTPPSGTTSAKSAAASSTGASSGSPAASGSTGGSSIDGDFTMFLKLLTTQLRNQDPLNPMDSSQFAVQLATFSGVEQQTKTNTLLAGIQGQLGQSGMSQLAGWIGMEAQTVAPTAFDGSPIALAPKPESGADQTLLVVTDASGRQVATADVPTSASRFTWTGQDSTGATLPSGTYNFNLENYQNGKLIGTDPVASFQTVVEAQASDTGTVLVLASGAKVDASSVTALRAAQ